MLTHYPNVVKSQMLFLSSCRKHYWTFGLISNDSSQKKHTMETNKSIIEHQERSLLLRGLIKLTRSLANKIQLLKEQCCSTLYGLNLKFGHETILLLGMTEFNFEILDYWKVVSRLACHLSPFVTRFHNTVSLHSIGGRRNSSKFTFEWSRSRGCWSHFLLGWSSLCGLTTWKWLID